MANQGQRIGKLVAAIDDALAEHSARSVAQWRPLSKAMVACEKDEGGAYELKDRYGTVIYIGSSNEVKRRLNEHLEESGTCIRRNAKKYRAEYTQSYRKREYELYQAHLRRYGKKLLCNVVSPPKP